MLYDLSDDESIGGKQTGVQLMMGALSAGAVQEPGSWMLCVGRSSFGLILQQRAQTR